MVHGVHAGQHRQQDLRGADVAGRLLAADVLLARLQGHAQGGVALGIHGNTDQAAGHAAHVFLAGGEVGGVRAAEAHGGSEALGGSECHVRTELAGRKQQGQAEQVRGHGHARPGGVGPFAEAAVVDHAAVGGRVLHERSEHAVVEGEALVVADHDLDAARLGAGAHHRDGLRVAQLGHEEHVGVVALDQTGQHVHGLGRGRALVEQRGARDIQAGQIDDHGLEVEQRLQPTLRHLGLVGRVGGVPTGVFQDVALDDRGNDAAVVAHPDERAGHAVAVGQAARLGQQLVLAQRRRQIHGRGQADGRGHGLADQLVQRAGAHDLEHRFQVALV